MGWDGELTRRRGRPRYLVDIHEMLIAMRCNVMQSVGRYSHAHKNPFQHWISKRIANRLFTVELGLEQHARVSKPTERYRRQRLEALEPHGWPQATYDFTVPSLCPTMTEDGRSVQGYPLVQVHDYSERQSRLRYDSISIFQQLHLTLILCST